MPPQTATTSPNTLNGRPKPVAGAARVWNEMPSCGRMCCPGSVPAGRRKMMVSGRKDGGEAMVKNIPAGAAGGDNKRIGRNGRFHQTQRVSRDCVALRTQ